MLQCFPVIYLFADMSSGQLREERPFLWLCIMAVACTSTQQQAILGDSVKQIVARDVLFHSENKLEFLLGLLIFIAWFVRSKYVSFHADYGQGPLSKLLDGLSDRSDPTLHVNGL